MKPCSGGGLENSVRTSENILSQSLKDVMKDDMTLSVGALSIQLDFNLQFRRVNNSTLTHITEDIYVFRIARKLKINAL